MRNKSFIQSMCKLIPCLVLLVCIVGSSRGEHPENDQINHRRGKIFNKQFWDGFERGLKDTADVFARVTDNLEVAIDQITDNFENRFSSFADRIDDRVEDSLPPFLRKHPSRASLETTDDYPEEEDEETFPIRAISGTLGSDGVDDGLEVYYSNGNEDEGVPEPTQIDISRLPNPTEVDRTPEPTPEENQEVEQNRNPFDIFQGPIFRPLGFGSGGNNFFNIFRRRQWWQGENVCVDREEIDESEKNSNDQLEADAEASTDEVPEDAEQQTESPARETRQNNLFSFSFGMEMSSCKDTADKYTCVTKTNRRGIFKTVTVTYRCCHGFVRDGQGCTKIDIRAMSETLENLNKATDFFSLVKAADLVNTVNERNLTIFAPTNEAIEEYTVDLEAQNDLANSIEGERNDIFRRKRETHNLVPTLLGHMIEDFLYAGDMEDEQVLTTLNPKSTLRINTYSLHPPTVTVNCARVIRANQHAKNGVVHTVDKVITPVEKSILEIIGSDPQFSILSKLLDQTEFAEELRIDGQKTLFAPTDAAFRKLKQSTLDSLLEGNSCLDAVLKQHILPNTICSAAIQGKRKAMNLLDEYLVVERTEDDRLLVDEAEIIDRDIVATNGVMHVIDAALMPNEAKTVGEILETHNLTKFIELAELADMMDELNAQKDVTVFAPTNRAIEGLSEESLTELKNDKEKLRELLQYHVTTPSIKSRNINNNHIADTRAGHPLRINLYSTMPLLTDIFHTRGRSPARVTAGCSRVSVLDSRACGAVVHIVEKMFEIPKSSVLEELKSVPHYSLFNQMVHDTGIDKELAEEGPFTILVPSDHALRTLPEDELQELMKDQKQKEMIVRRHIMKEHLCCSGINANSIFIDRKRLMDDTVIHVRRSPSGKLMAGASRITRCGSPTNNGIVHTVNRVLVNDREIGGFVHGRPDGPGLRLFSFPRLTDIIRF